MSILRNLYYNLPPTWRFLARRMVYFPIDVWEGLSGHRDNLTPPKGLIYTGGGDFRAAGRKMVGLFQDHAHLQPNHQVLDIGSGIGRIAVALTEFLMSEGRYEGFDVVELGVNWCKKNISQRFSNFNFQYIPLDNDLYRSEGQDARDFRFPYEDNRFDLVVLISVFTHMLPGEVSHYMKEIERVLKPGGHCFATFFVLNPESEQLMPQSSFNFKYHFGDYSLMSKKVKAANVAFQENYLRECLVESQGLQLKSVHPGHWCGRPAKECLDFQDIVIISKP